MSMIKIVSEKVVRPSRPFLMCTSNMYERWGSHPVSMLTILTFNILTHAHRTLQGSSKAPAHSTNIDNSNVHASRSCGHCGYAPGGEDSRARLATGDHTAHGSRSASTCCLRSGARAAQTLPRPTVTTSQQAHPKPRPTAGIASRPSRPTRSASSRRSGSARKPTRPV